MKEKYWVYILALDNYGFYVGITLDVEKRYNEHISGTGAFYTKKNKPLGIVFKQQLMTYIKKEAEEIENVLSMNMINKYGAERIRGGIFISSEDSEEDIYLQIDEYVKQKPGYLNYFNMSAVDSIIRKSMQRLDLDYYSYTYDNRMIEKCREKVFAKSGNEAVKRAHHFLDDKLKLIPFGFFEDIMCWCGYYYYEQQINDFSIGCDDSVRKQILKKLIKDNIIGVDDLVHNLKDQKEGFEEIFSGGYEEMVDDIGFLVMTYSDKG